MTPFHRLCDFARGLFSRNQKIRFVVVGGLNTLAGYCIYAALMMLGASIFIASLLSLLFGIVVGFLAQGKIVFGGISKKAFIRFVGVWGLIYMAHLSIVYAARHIGINPYIGGIVAIPFVVCLSFVLQRNFVFRRPR